MTILVFGVVLLVLGVFGVGYWRYVDVQTLHLQERNFRSLTVTGQALANLVANYESVFKSVIEGEPPDPQNTQAGSRSDSKDARHTAYEEALQAIPSLQKVTIAKEGDKLIGSAVRFIRERGVASIKLRYVHQDRTETRTRWRVEALINFHTIMRQLVTEDIFSDVLLANRSGEVLYHHQSTRDPSGFVFEDVSTLLHRLNDSESKGAGAEKGGAEGKKDLVSTLPLFNEALVGGISHAIFAQATDGLVDPETDQVLILVGIVPAGQFHAEARAIPLNYLLLMAGLLLLLFFMLPFAKLRTNMPTERLTSSSVAVLMISAVLGTAVMTFGLADIATYRNSEQHLDTRLKAVSEEIRRQFNDDVQRGLEQLAMVDQSCQNNEKCSDRLKGAGKVHLAQRLCIRLNERKEFLFFPTDESFPTKSDDCSQHKNNSRDAKVFHPDVKTMFWVGSAGELKVLQSRESNPWKYANLQERQYVRRILMDDTLIRKNDGRKFWIEPIFSRTTGENAAVFSMKSMASSEGRSPDGSIVAALEIKLSSVTGVGVPPGMGFAVTDQEGKVLFHSDSRRNLRENLFEETDRDGRLRQAVFARATSQFDGRYWGKDRRFHIAPLFLADDFIEAPDVYWSLVTYWDTDILQALNLRALYSSGVLFLIYGVIISSMGIAGWWMYSRANETAYRWVWSQWVHLHRYQIAIGLFVISLVAVSIWYLRPHSYLDMLLWGLLPALATAAVMRSITHSDADPTDHNMTDRSVRRMYPRSYALLVMAGLLTFVVIPALVIFRVAMDVEWRLLAKFSQFDLVRDRAIQAQEVRKSYPSTLFHDTSHNGEVRKEFLQKFSGPNFVYTDFPFESRWREGGDRDSSSSNAVQRGDERLIRWLYHVIIDRPRIGHSGVETEMFLEATEQWDEPEWGTLELTDRSKGTTSPIGLKSWFPSPIPQWLYSLLVFGGLVPLAVLRVKQIYAFAAGICVLAVSLWFGVAGQALAVLGVSGLLYGAYYVLPRFAAQRVLLLEFPYPSVDSTATNTRQRSAGMFENRQPRAEWTPGLWDVYVKEMSALPDALCLADEPTLCGKILKQDIKDDFGIMKERIIQEILERVTQYYMQIWKNCTASQCRSLFNLARDGFLYARNPDIGPLLKNGLIVADLNLRPMNESFRRFIIRTGLEERLDEDIAQQKASTWLQVWRPIGVGLVLVMVFLVLTQEQYRAITLAFLGVLPALLGAFSQALTSSKKEKLESASTA
ncbi:MAG TPA: hypothetical protein VF078_10815 [Nitrospira sp.]